MRIASIIRTSHGMSKFAEEEPRPYWLLGHEIHKLILKLQADLAEAERANDHGEAEHLASRIAMLRQRRV